MGEGIFQPMHLLVLLVVCILLFAPKRLGELGKGLGEGIRDFKKAMRPDPPKTEAPRIDAPANTATAASTAASEKKE